VINSTLAVKRSIVVMERLVRLQEGNAEDIFGAAQSGLKVAVNGYSRMLPPQHSVCSAMQAIKTLIPSY